MDRITKSLLTEFQQAQSLTALDESAAFERLGNHCVVSGELSDTFNVEDVSSGGGNDIGTDGIAIIANGVLATSVDDIEDVGNANGYLDVDFVFVQSKTSPSFSAADVGSFGFGIADFFSETPKLPQNDFVKAARAISVAVFDRAHLFTRQKPTCKLYYVTTGSWQDDVQVVARFTSAVDDLKATGLFSAVTYFPIDADRLLKLYQATKNRIAREFVFANKTVLPSIDGVSEAYLGVLPASEYLKLISDDFGGIRKSVFYDNVRDFQGDNDVNKDIASTLRSSQVSGRFALLNNGVTVVAKSLRTVGNRFFIEDYQIVNGCQTSHVLYNERAMIGDNVFVPVKVIGTADDGIISAVIKCTNSQTEIRPEQLHALSDVQKRLESYFASFGEKQRLYYERRSQQYNNVAGVEKVRIITVQQQIRAFSSMFLNEPHRATRSYASLLKRIGSGIFSAEHKLEPYYTSALAHYRLEYFFRSNQLDARYKAARYQLLMAVRCILAGKEMPSLAANKMEKYCETLMTSLWDDKLAIKAFVGASNIVDATCGGSLDFDTLRTESFTSNVLAKL